MPRPCCVAAGMMSTRSLLFLFSLLLAAAPLHARVLFETTFEGDGPWYGCAGRQCPRDAGKSCWSRQECPSGMPTGYSIHYGDQGSTGPYGVNGSQGYQVILRRNASSSSDGTLGWVDYGSEYPIICQGFHYRTDARQSTGWSKDYKFGRLFGWHPEHHERANCNPFALNNRWGQQQGKPWCDPQPALSLNSRTTNPAIRQNQAEVGSSKGPWASVHLGPRGHNPQWHPPGQDINLSHQTNEPPVRIADDEWHAVIQCAQINTRPGNFNGWAYFQVDGEVIHNVSGVTYNGPAGPSEQPNGDPLGFNGASLGGNAKNSAAFDAYRWYDNHVVTTGTSIEAAAELAAERLQALTRPDLGEVPITDVVGVCGERDALTGRVWRVGDGRLRKCQTGDGWDGMPPADMLRACLPFDAGDSKTLLGIVGSTVKVGRGDAVCDRNVTADELLLLTK